MTLTGSPGDPGWAKDRGSANGHSVKALSSQPQATNEHSQRALHRDQDMEPPSGGVYGEISALCYLGICQLAEMKSTPQDDPLVAEFLSS